MSNLQRLAAASALVLTVLIAPLGLAESFNFSGDRLVVANLIGEVTVTGGGSDFSVEVTRGGADGDRIEVIESDGRSSELTLRFPKASTYIYPRLGARSNTSFTMGDHDNGGWLSQLIGGLSGRDRIKVRGSGSGTEAWADLTIQVPTNGTLEMRLGVGTAIARDVDGEISLYVKSGTIQADRVAGEFLADTGSGHVEVRDARGNLSIDTGSGHVTAKRVSTDAAEIDTGSGGVELELERMGSGRFVIDTGSGGVRLKLPMDASAEIEADTGSGGIDLDLAGEITMRSKSRDNVRFSIGGGAAQVSIDTGSGGVRIRQ